MCQRQTHGCKKRHIDSLMGRVWDDDDECDDQWGIQNIPEYMMTRERNVLFNDALNIFYLRLYDARHIVKDHSDSERKPAAVTWTTLSD